MPLSLDEIYLGVDDELCEGFLDLCDLELDPLLIALVLSGANLLQQVFVATLHEDKGTPHGLSAKSTWRHGFLLSVLLRVFIRPTTIFSSFVNSHNKK